MPSGAQCWIDEILFGRGSWTVGLTRNYNQGAEAYVGVLLDLPTTDVSGQSNHSWSVQQGDKTLRFAAETAATREVLQILWVECGPVVTGSRKVPRDYSGHLSSALQPHGDLNSRVSLSHAMWPVQRSHTHTHTMSILSWTCHASGKAQLAGVAPENREHRWPRKFGSGEGSRRSQIRLNLDQ